MKTDELREKYLAFFESKGCVRRPSDVLVPRWDPSVLFTPAGMNQFKDHFLGKCKLDFTRATTCQKCLRTGDIDNVGRTAYHHTFFEMLGNFSFGDYFKREAIHWAWEFLTSKKWLGLDRRPAHACRSISTTTRRPTSGPTRSSCPPNGSSGWARTTTSGRPAPPAKGPTASAARAAKSFITPHDGGAVEIWNLVFTQFNRVGDPPNNLRPLPSKNIDTGMGLERTAAVLQGVDTNYHIDILRPLVEAAGRSLRREVRSGQRKRPPAAAHRRSRAGLHVRHSRERLSRPEQGKVRHQAAAAPGRARWPSDGPARAVLAPARAGGGRADAQARIPNWARRPTRVAQVIEKEEENFFAHDRRRAGPHRARLPRHDARPAA